MRQFDHASEILGEQSVYPGHPLVIAYCITQRFDSMAEATTKPPGAEFMPALSDSVIPGAGGNVYNAIDVLRTARSAGIDAALNEAERAWAACDDQQRANPTRWREGWEQARRFQDRFVAALASWP